MIVCRIVLKAPRRFGPIEEEAKIVVDKIYGSENNDKHDHNSSSSTAASSEATIAATTYRQDQLEYQSPERVEEKIYM